MRRARTLYLAPIFVLAIATTAFAELAQEGRQGGGQGQGGGRGRGSAGPACTTMACDLQQEWERTRDTIVNAADAMPEAMYSFKPTPAQRSFGEQVMHIVQVDVKVLSGLGGKTPAPNINMKATTKADIMAAVRQSFDYGAAVLKEFNDQQLLERVMSLPFMGPSVSRVRVLAFDMGHSQDIYGQMVVYLRLNGITPPASRRGGA